MRGQMKKQVGNIELEIHQADSQGDVFTVYLSVRTSAIKQLNLTEADARDLRYALSWALDGCPIIGCKIFGPHEHEIAGPSIC